MFGDSKCYVYKTWIVEGMLQSGVFASLKIGANSEGEMTAFIRGVLARRYDEAIYFRAGDCFALLARTRFNNMSWVRSERPHQFSTPKAT